MAHDPITFESTALPELSPKTILNSFHDSDALSSASDHISLDTITNASASERALAIRAITADKQLQEWVEQIRSWPWPPNAFEDAPGSVDVDNLEKRMEVIRDGEEDLDLEELKTHVRLAHIFPRSLGHEYSSIRSRSSSYQGSLDGSDTTEAAIRQSYMAPMGTTFKGHLDDFTALITMTIMHALPYVRRLNELLEIWSTRLDVLRRIPDWKKGMSNTELALNAGWKSIGRDHGSGSEKDYDLNRTAFETIKDILQKHVDEQGQRTDAMLDILEGRDDTLPEQWIDHMDEVEEDYRRWVVEAEKVVRRNEWGPESPPDIETREAALTGKIGGGDEETESPIPRQLTEQKTLGSISKMSSMESMSGSSLDGTVSPIGSYYSGMSSPELMDAARVEYFTVPNDTLADLNTNNNVWGSLSRHSSQRTERAPSITPNATPGLGNEPPKLRLSTSPILRVVNVTRTSSQRSVVTLSLPSPKETVSPVQWQSSAVEVLPTIDANEDESPEIPGIQQSPHGDGATSDYTSQHEDLPPHPHISPVANSKQYSETAITFDTNQSSLESQKARTDEQTLSSEITPPDSFTSSPTLREFPQVEHPVEVTGTKPHETPVSPKTTDEHFEERISSILTTIPTHIHLASAPQPTKKLEPTSKPRWFSGSNKTLSTPDRPTKPNRLSSTFQTPTLTLAPATKSSTRARHPGEPDIKLYHLHQPGKDQPIKLFIRLIGENGERVMVRVGGGWADLGEYLKEYASHHTRRSTSEAKMSFTNAADVPSSPTTATPPSPKHGRKSSQEIGSSPLTPNFNPTVISHQPVQHPSNKNGILNMRKTRPATDSPTESRLNHLSIQEPTFSNQDHPRSASAASQSLATNLVNHRRTSSRHSMGDDDSFGPVTPTTPLGLAGPNSRRAEMSPTKQAWVEGMLDQARKVSSGVGIDTKGRRAVSGNVSGNLGNGIGSAMTGSNGINGSPAGMQQSEFGGLGKVGATKRIFMRNGSGRE
ncbi:hypothetical protein MMC25_001183 [Agyrium rufum]|nr:hypothetical protein [Agyrium rufum]